MALKPGYHHVNQHVEETMKLFCVNKTQI